MEVVQVQLLLRINTVKEKLVREKIQLGGEGLVTVTLEVISDSDIGDGILWFILVMGYGLYW